MVHGYLTDKQLWDKIKETKDVDLGLVLAQLLERIQDLEKVLDDVRDEGL